VHDVVVDESRDDEAMDKVTEYDSLLLLWEGNLSVSLAACFAAIVC